MLVDDESELNLVVNAASTNVTPFLILQVRAQKLLLENTRQRAGNLVAMLQHDHRDYADGSGIHGFNDRPSSSVVYLQTYSPTTATRESKPAVPLRTSRSN
jgi:hypothetical protein